jgi:hypothetical protein
MTTTPDNIEFSSGVMETFGFLVDQYAFVVSSVEQDAVKFANDDLILEVFREPRSFMIYVQLCYLSTGEVFVLHEILKALVPEKKLTAQCNGMDSVGMLNCLNRLSQICRQNLHHVFVGDKSTLQNVALSARKDRRTFTLECQYGPIRDRANLAWDQKDWAAAKNRYEESLPILTIAEKRRLDFLIQRGTGQVQ